MLKKPILHVVLCVLLCLTFASLPAKGIQEDSTDYGIPASPGASLPILEHWQDMGDNPDAWKIVSEDDGWTLVDGIGTAVPLKKYEKIVITSAGAVEICYMIGGESSIAAIGTSSAGIWPEDLTAALPSVGGLSRPSFEKILSFEPDLVIANGMNTELVTSLNKKGIPAIIHGTDTIAEIMNAVLVLGALTGTEDSAIALVAERNAALEQVRASLADKPLGLKGAFVYSVEPMMAFTDESLPGQILTILGVENLASGLKTDKPILSPEYLLAENPDFLLGAMSIENESQILHADAVVASTRAGKEHNIWIVPSYMILRPTPRVIDALQLLHEKLTQLSAR